ncbi:MAG: DUF3445 domain-containing protein [Pseudomonadota bacterium]
MSAPVPSPADFAAHGWQGPIPGHSPSGGRGAPPHTFSIGLSPLRPGTFPHRDALFDAYVAEKRRLASVCFGDVFVAAPGTEDAQREVAELLAAQGAYAPGAPAQGAHAPACVPAAKRTTADAAAPAGISPPLWRAALGVQEDLVIMSRRHAPERGVPEVGVLELGASEGAWWLAAGAVCFPSAWRLREKFLKPMHAVHAQVPGFGPGTRQASMIERIFAGLVPDQPVERLNWSIDLQPELHKPDADELQFADTAAAGSAWLRVERQTLHKLPASGDVLFTIRIYENGLEQLRAHPDAARIAAGLARLVHGLSEPQAAYKGLQQARGALLALLESTAHPDPSGGAEG